MAVHMTVWGDISKKIRVALIFLLMLLFLPHLTHAALTSSNYTVSNYSIGSQGSTMSSSQYSLTPSKGSVVTQSGEEEAVTPSRHGHGTSTRKDVTNKPNEQEVISEIHIERPGVQIDVPRGTVFNTEDIEKRNIEQKSNEDIHDSVSEIDSDNDNQKGKDSHRSRFVANLISGDLHNAFGSLKEMFAEMSKHFYARLGVFVFVLLALWIVRSYTAIGKRFSPF